MNEALSLFAEDEAALVAIGHHLGNVCHRGTVYLRGNLGAGKTTLCRGVLRSRGHGGAVKSPTYTLVEPYELAGGKVYHFDLYRLGDPEELEYMGVRDYFDGDCLCIVEWPERGLGFLPEADINIAIRVEGGGRRVSIMASSPSGQKVVNRLKDAMEKS